MDYAEKERIKDALKHYTENATKSSEAARNTLVREGIYCKDGKLSASYTTTRKSA